MSRTILWWAVGAVALSVACARQGSPPGGTPDRIPPFVISTRPDTFGVVEAFTSSVRVEFNERISERVSGGSMNNAVEVSPRTGDVRVRHRRRAIDVSMQGGFVEGVVYRITVLPVIQDMFGNPLREPFEFFFSTGPDFTDNALAGVLDDRITLQPVEDARVDAWPQQGDSVAYTTLSGDEGIFALRGVPEGTYDVVAYLDVNRNFEPDFTEPQARIDGQELGTADTALVFLELLQPDTTPAVLIAAEPVDSTTLEIGFDDYLDPDSSLTGVSVQVLADSLAPDTLSAPAAVRILHAHAYEDGGGVRADSLRVVADSLAALEAAADTTQEGPRPPPAELEPEEAPADTVPERLAPSQMVYVLLDGPLAFDARYRATASGVTNIAGLPGGGGDIPFRGPEPPPPPDSVPPDSLATDTLALPDSAGAVGDSTSVQPDTATVQPDTATVQPDTATVQPDTATVQPDTTAVPADTSGAQPDTAAAPPSTATSASAPIDVAGGRGDAAEGRANRGGRLIEPRSPGPAVVGTSVAGIIRTSRSLVAELGLRRLRD